MAHTETYPYSTSFSLQHARAVFFRPGPGQRTVAAARRYRGGSGNLRGFPFTLDGADRQGPRERWSALAAEASGQAGDVLLLCDEFSECKSTSRENQNSSRSRQRMTSPRKERDMPAA